jgi:hypothetical protein
MQLPLVVKKQTGQMKYTNSPKALFKNTLFANKNTQLMARPTMRTSENTIMRPVVYTRNSEENKIGASIMT